MATRRVPDAFLLISLVLIAQAVPSNRARARPGGPHASYSGILDGEPFQAALEGNTRDEFPDGRMVRLVTRGTISRDSKGRTRQEVEMTTSDGASATASGEGRFITIYDPLSQAVYRLDPAKKTRQRISLGTSAPPPQSQGWSFVGVKQGKHTPDRAQIEGLNCRKVLIETTEGESGYLWISDDLREVLIEQVGTRYSWRLTGIVRGEPDPKLFEIPPDYEDVTPAKPSGVPAQW